MRINSIKNIIKTGGAALIIGGSTYIAYDTIRDTKNYKSVNDLKKEIIQKDPKRYDAILKRPVIEQPFNYKDWEYETKIMNDSLKIDSLTKKVKKAFNDGAQMVRDSIAHIK